MRIAMLGVKAVPTIGGIARYVEEIGARLVERGHHVTVYCRPHYAEGNGTYRGMERTIVRGLRGKHLDAITHTLTSLMDARRRDFDILHFHAVGPAVLAPWARRSRAAVVVTAHGADWDRAKWGPLARIMLRSGARASAQCADGWVAVSSHVADECERLAPRRAEVIPSGTRTVETPPPKEIMALGLQPQEYLFCAARLTPEKGLHHLIEAYRRVGTPKKLVVAGSCPHRSRYADKLMAHSSDRIRFVGFVQGRVLDELFGHAYLYCQPSKLEGLPMSVLEAMNHGTCVLASDIEPHIEALEACGYTFRCGDVGDLAAKLDCLLAQPDEVHRRGETGRRHVRENRTWDVTTDHYEVLYRRLIDKA